MGHRSTFRNVRVAGRSFGNVRLRKLDLIKAPGVRVNFLTVILGSLAMSYPLLALDPHRRDAGEAMDNTVLEGKGQEGCVP